MRNYNHVNVKSNGLSSGRESFISTIGNKIKSTAETLGHMKAIYDIGKGIYSVLKPAAQAAAILL